MNKQDVLLKEIIFGKIFSSKNPKPFLPLIGLMWKILLCNVNLFSAQLSKSHVLQVHCSTTGRICSAAELGVQALCWQWYHWGLAKPALTMLDSLSLCTDDTDPKVWSTPLHCATVMVSMCTTYLQLTALAQWQSRQYFTSFPFNTKPLWEPRASHSNFFPSQTRK